MNLTGAFWRFAHQRYHARKPSIMLEIWLLLIGGFFLLSFMVSFVGDWVKVTDHVEAVMIFAFPLVIALMHRRIRIERAKGPDALYRKRSASNR